MLFDSKAYKLIKQLNPEKDHWQIVRLALFCEFPWDATRALELALFKTYAVPSISKILHGTRELEHHTQKRYDDTDLILSLIVENGLEHGEGKFALERMNWIHSHYPISNEDYLYVLSTFVIDSKRWINEFGYRKVCRNEEIALHKVWLEIGTAMHIKDIPPTFDALEEFHSNYEKEHFRYTENNKKLAISAENLMLGWIFPKMLFNVNRPFLHAVMEPHLLKALGLDEPPKALRVLVKQILRARSFAEALNPNREPFYRSTMNTYRHYKNGYSINELGPEKLLKRKSDIHKK